MSSSLRSRRIRSNCSTLDNSFNRLYLSVNVMVDITDGKAGRSRVGPNQSIKTAPGGATSGWHTQARSLRVSRSAYRHAQASMEIGALCSAPLGVQLDRLGPHSSGGSISQAISPKFPVVWQLR